MVAAVGARLLRTGASSSWETVSSSTPQPMAVAAAFWTAAPVAVAPAAANTAAANAGGPAMRERAGRKAPLRATSFDDGDVIKF